MLYNNLIIRAL